MTGNESWGFWAGNIVNPCDFHLCEITGFQKYLFWADINKKEENPKSHKFDEYNKKPRWEKRWGEYFMRLYTRKHQNTSGHILIYTMGGGETLALYI